MRMHSKLPLIPEHWLFLLLAALLLASCNRPRRVEPGLPSAGKEPGMEKINEFLVVKDDEIIRSFMQRMGWEMIQTQTGLWYMVYEDGAGEKIIKGKILTFDYSLSLLDGTVCYSSAEDGSRQLVAGQGVAEAGLEEGLLLLKEGDRARFIIPPHLAHGLLGDGMRIPARSVILYDVWNIEIIKTKI